MRERLFDKGDLEPAQRGERLLRLLQCPGAVGVESDRHVLADDVADRPDSSHVIVEADLDLDLGTPISFI